MPTNVFVSYDHDDQNQVNGFKAIKYNPNSLLRQWLKFSRLLSIKRSLLLRIVLVKRSITLLNN